tara:strand:+ start:3115 stop:4287 length:1173 start_codon:yes stop_codon:yes gene_type:complete
MKYNFAIVGSGYVGMSLGALISSKHNVIIHDIDINRVNKINNGQSTIEDNDIESFIEKNEFPLSATTEKSKAYNNADFVIIATPTDYDDKSNKFDTSTVEEVIKDIISINKKALIVIKSTIPVGFTDMQNLKNNTDKIIFSPEFLREGQALADNLNPSRIIIGGNSNKAKVFGDILRQCSKNNHAKMMFTSSKNAEAIKLFSNTYLAMRVAFFNELDTFSMVNELDTKDIIEGVCEDSRIGTTYNNPSFGYGGYCLPKDTKQLLSNYSEIPQDIIRAIVNSNETRKDFIANHIIKLNKDTIGFYRLSMKEGSDNYRSSAVLGIIEKLLAENKEVIIFEPLLNENIFEGVKIEENLDSFKKKSDLIISNRISDDLKDVEHKTFSRDIFGEN